MLNDPSNQAGFRSTRWSIVAAARDPAAPEAAVALAQLCEQYWYPLYVFARRRGYSADEAQDLTQGFFTRMIEKHDAAAANPQRGRFRTFLLSAFQHYISNQRDRDAALKRGGGTELLPLDFGDAEDRYIREPAHNDTPETAYIRRWVLALLERVLARLEAEFSDEGKADLFARLKPFLTPEADTPPYRELCISLNISESALKVAVHRMRRRYRDLLTEEVAHTLTSPEQVQEEITFLIQAFSKP